MLAPECNSEAIGVNSFTLPRTRTCVILVPMAAPAYFIPNRDARTLQPLRDFLNAPPVSVARAYIEALTAPGDVVLDPFGTTPNVAYAACALERRVIVLQSNPLWAWLARTLATLPPASEIIAALARLGDVPKDDVSLRTYVNQLYATRCAACHQLTPADYFVRTRDGGVLARHYTCVHCHTTRDDPATEDDLQRAQAIAPRGMHYHFALARVVPEGGLHSERIQRMLDVYTPRNLAALVTITQKIQARLAQTRARDVLWLLMLHLLERGTAFYPRADAEPQLARPATFIEFNLWYELERAARALAEQTDARFTLADSPRAVVNAVAPVYIGQGSFAQLARQVPRGSIALVLTAPPTRRVALYALTYLWGAWILGRAAVAGLVPFLDTRKDATWEWRWYTETLDQAMQTIAPLLRADAHVVFVFTEAWHAVIEALMLAAARARLHLDTFVFQPRLGEFPRGEFDDLRGEYRLAFTLTRETSRRPSDTTTLEQQMRAAAFAAARDILTRRGEALAFSWVHHAALARLARDSWLANVFATPLKTSPHQFVRRALFAGLQDGYAHDFDHYASTEQFVWFRRASVNAPLIERVEDAVREHLARGTISIEELCDAIYRQFPGDLTPEAGLVELCAAAYAQMPATEERARALDALAQLGTRLGYTIIFDLRCATSASIENQKSPIENFDMVWQSDGEMAYAFVWRARARFDDLAHIHIAPARGCLIVPENFVALVREKTRRLPHLTDAFHEAGWNFVRVAAIARLLEKETLERAAVLAMLGLTPPILQDGAQLELF